MGGARFDGDAVVWAGAEAAEALMDDGADGERARRRGKEMWRANGGLVVVRAGEEAAARCAPEDLVRLSRAFGEEVERNPGVDPDFLRTPEVQVLGNVRDAVTGKPRALFQAARRQASVTYDPNTASPVWHTDQLFRRPQPRGSALMCITAPPTGGATAFAPTTLAALNLPADVVEELRSLVLHASYAHHNAACKRVTPSYPLLTPEERERHPPVALPVVCACRETGELALNCFNSSVFAILPAGEALSPSAVARYEATGEKHPSVASFYARFLPHVTAAGRAYAHAWLPGDVAVWDNECTVHAPTWFDHTAGYREMWRTTFR